MDNGDGRLDPYEALEYSRTAFDLDNNGKLSPDELGKARKQVHHIV